MVITITPRTKKVQVPMRYYGNKFVRILVVLYSRWEVRQPEEKVVFRNWIEFTGIGKLRARIKRGKSARRFLSRTVCHVKILIGKISREGVQSRRKVRLTAFSSRKVMKSIQHRIGPACVQVRVVSGLCYFFPWAYRRASVRNRFHARASVSERDAFGFSSLFRFNQSPY